MVEIHSIPFSLFQATDTEAQHAELEEAIKRVLELGKFIRCAEVADHESQFTTWLGYGKAVGVASGTDTLDLILRSLHIGFGHKVAFPALSADACVSAVRRSGTEIDQDSPESWHLSDLNPPIPFFWHLPHTTTALTNT